MQLLVVCTPRKIIARRIKSQQNIYNNKRKKTPITNPCVPEEKRVHRIAVFQLSQIYSVLDIAHEDAPLSVDVKQATIPNRAGERLTPSQ